MQADPEDIKKWQAIANRRQAILPTEFKFVSKNEIAIYCGGCLNGFVRPLIVGQNDPVIICPKCQKRNYVPIDWNITKRSRQRY